MNLLSTNDSALLVIDMQPGFYPPERRDVDRSALTTVFDNAAWIVEVARELEIPVVVAEEDPQKNGPTHPDIATALPTSTNIHCKTTFGAASDPHFMTDLDNTGRSTAILVGTETDICVCHTALGLQETGRRVAAIHDCLYSPKTAHDSGLQRMRAAGIDILSAKQVMYDWLPSLDQSRQFLKSHPQLSQPAHFNL